MQFIIPLDTEHTVSKGYNHFEIAHMLFESIHLTHV